MGLAKALVYSLFIASISVVYAVDKNDVINSISSAAIKVGVSSDYMCRLADAESNWNPKAKNKSSSAKGLFQIISSTERYLREKYNVNGNIYDSYSNALLASYYTKESIRYYKSKKIEVNHLNLYIAHFFGQNRATEFINALPDAKVKDLFPKEYKYNKALFKDRTIKELKIIFQNKLDKARNCNG